MTSAPQSAEILRQCALTVHDGVAVLYAPVHSHHHKICLLTRQAHLMLDHIGLAGVDDIGCHILILADTVGVFSIGVEAMVTPLTVCSGMRS